MKADICLRLDVEVFEKNGKWNGRVGYGYYNWECESKGEAEEKLKARCKEIWGEVVDLSFKQAKRNG